MTAAVDEVKVLQMEYNFVGIASLQLFTFDIYSGWGSGLYDNLQKYNLPDPQSVFDIGFFHENPEPFFDLCKELFPDNLRVRCNSK